MNKQEYQQKIKNMKRPKFFYAITLDEAYEAGFEEAKNNALFESCFLDEPEKPVLTKAEAEWVKNLTEFFDTPDALYYITRCGYSEYPFTFDFWGDTYELPIEEGIEYGELNKIRERLVNAVVYGYEVEKEKLYTVKLKSTNEYMFYDKDYREIYHIRVSDDGANQSEAYHFTEDKLIKYHAWENEAYEIKEVKE